MGYAERLVKYKLVRFIDQTVEKGRQYRYRVKVYVEDPNYPSDLYEAPSLAGLHEEAQTRVRDLEAKDAKSGSEIDFPPVGLQPRQRRGDAATGGWVPSGKRRAGIGRIGGRGDASTSTSPGLTRVKPRRCAR
jgi:hypothetical protein